MPLTGAPVTSGTGESVTIETVVAGSRDGGHHEVQLLNIYTENSVTAADLSGWFILSFLPFNGTLASTQYIAVNASASDVERELNQLSSLRLVTVTKSSLVQNSSLPIYAGYQVI